MFKLRSHYKYLYRTFLILSICFLCFQCKESSSKENLNKKKSALEKSKDFGKEDIVNQIDFSPYQGFINSKNGLNIRNAPNLESDKIMTIPAGEKVSILRRTGKFETLNLDNNRTANGQWVYVSYTPQNSNKEIMGYVYDYFINFSFDSRIEHKTFTDIKEAFRKNKTCVMDKVSKNFLYSMKGLEYDNETNRPTRVRIEIQGITNKNAMFQRIDFYLGLWYAYGEVPCTAINYFKKSNDRVIGELGYFNIWDYNMDGLEDFAVLYDQGGSAGSWYEYFFQQDNGTFEQEESFPFSLFPSSIDFKNKTITEGHPVGCCKISTATFKNTGKNTWKLIESTTEDLTIEN